MRLIEPSRALQSPCRVVKTFPVAGVIRVLASRAVSPTRQLTECGHAETQSGSNSTKQNELISHRRRQSAHTHLICTHSTLIEIEIERDTHTHTQKETHEEHTRTNEPRKCIIISLSRAPSQSSQLTVWRDREGALRRTRPFAPQVCNQRARANCGELAGHNLRALLPKLAVNWIWSKERLCGAWRRTREV